MLIFLLNILSNLDNFCVTTSLPQLMDVVRSNYEAMIDRHHGGPNFMMHSGISQASEYDDPPGLREKAEYLLREWVNLYHSAAAGRDSTKAFSAFVGQVKEHSKYKCFLKARIGLHYLILSLMHCSFTDAPAGHPEDRRPHHSFLPAVHRDVRGDQLPCSSRTAAPDHQPCHHQGQVLP